MASQQDIDAIVNQGGITVDQFPPLESDLNYIINDFLPVDYAVVEEVIFNVSADSTSVVDVVAAEDVTFDIATIAVITNATEVSSDTNFDIATASTTSVDTSITEDVLFSVDSTSAADNQVDVALDILVSFDTEAATSADIELQESAAFDVVTNATGDVFLEISEDAPFTVLTDALVDPVAELSAEADFLIASSSELSVSVETSVSAPFTVDHDGELFSVEPAYLQEDTAFSITTQAVARNTTYTQGNILDIPVWSWPPNWSSDVTETLQWLTSVLSSPTGAEQRRAMRIYPRRQFEFTALSIGRERSYLDQFLITHGARDMYLPIWHETHLCDEDALAGSKSIPCSTISYGEFREGDIIILMGESAFDYELAEITAISGLGVTIAYPLAKTWPMDTPIHPVRKSRLTDQPQPARVTNNVVTCQVRFQTAEQNDDILFDPSSPVIGGLNDFYRDSPVITTLPEERDSLNFTFSRLLEEADNNTGIPVRVDTADVGFTSQGYAITAYGRQENWMLRSLLYGLRGRATSVWLPTFFEDMVMVSDTSPGDTRLTIENIRFGACGGPRENRRDILIQKFDGTFLYRRILGSTVDENGNEIIGVDTGFADGLQASDVISISFMTFCRLDQDQVDIVHKTDSAGASTCALTFKSAPDLRAAGSGF